MSDLAGLRAQVNFVTELAESFQIPIRENRDALIVVQRDLTELRTAMVAQNSVILAGPQLGEAFGEWVKAVSDWQDGIECRVKDLEEKVDALYAARGRRAGS